MTTTLSPPTARVDTPLAARGGSLPGATDPPLGCAGPKPPHREEWPGADRNVLGSAPGTPPGGAS